MEHYYQEVPGWTDQDMEALYREAIARTPEGGMLVEIGCWKGRSLCYLLVEAKNSGKNLSIYGVDHFEGSVGEPTLLQIAEEEDLLNICKQNCLRAGYPFTLHCQASTFAAECFRDASLDFIFIDASHDYDSVRADIVAWLPKVKPGGLLAGHDAGAPGVSQAIAEVLPQAHVEGSIWSIEVPT